MARFSLVGLVRDFARDRNRFVATHPNAVLMWTPLEDPASFIEKTLVSREPVEGGFGQGGPIVAEVVKGTANGFPFGVTIGHAESNDIVVPHEQVSRFHAYIKSGPPGPSLVDAESTNGTFLDGVRLAPNKAVQLPAEARISFGGVVVTYLEPLQLVARLAAMLGPAAPG